MSTNVILGPNPPPVHQVAAVEIVIRATTEVATMTMDVASEATVAATMVMVAMATTT
jgi:hypothetical protein